jgi:hypothetical protein
MGTLMLATLVMSSGFLAGYVFRDLAQLFNSRPLRKPG